MKKFAIPSTYDSTWAKIQVYQGINIGPITWWRLGINSAHPNDVFGLEITDTNWEYRRAIFNDVEFKSFLYLRDHIFDIVNAGPWVMNEGDWSGWVRNQEPSSLFVSRFNRCFNPLQSQ